MKKIWLLKILGINLLLFMALFLVAKATRASSPVVEVNMVDEDGNKFSISFNTNDYYEEYDTSDNNSLRVHDDDYAAGKIVI